MWDVWFHSQIVCSNIWLPYLLLIIFILHNFADLWRFLHKLIFCHESGAHNIPDYYQIIWLENQCSSFNYSSCKCKSENNLRWPEKYKGISIHSLKSLAFTEFNQTNRINLWNCKTICYRWNFFCRKKVKLIRLLSNAARFKQLNGWPF